ncbi:MAG TPA: recombinase family protein [Candidatus Paceibacterota bacterium]|nr:recombinase family protein [Candidatus Paceibacterota bacterium]
MTVLLNKNTDDREKNGIVYVRVSSWEQVSNTSLEKQLKDCKEYASRNGIKVLDEFVEEGESAKSANRTQFQKALAFCAKSRPDFFIVYKIDRFARNQDDHVVTRALLKRYGTELRSVTEAIDGSTIGRLQEGILSVFAEFDNNVRAERSKGGMIEKVRKGVWIWQAPLGYKRLTKGGNLIIDDDYAHFIATIFSEFSKGTYSYRAIAEHMANRGFRTRNGKKPRQQLMEKLIRNPVYCGKIVAFGEEVQATFPAIVDESLWWKCQPGIRRKANFVPHKINNPNFPLRGTVCLACSQKITGSYSTGRKGVKYSYYHHYRKGCDAVKNIPKETFEQNFIECLNEITPSERYAKIFKAIVLDIWQSNYKKLDSENERVRKEIQNLEIERQRVFDLHRSGKYTDEEFLEQKNIVNTVVQQKTRLLEEKRIEAFDMDAALEYCFRFVRQTADTWIALEKLPAHRMRFQKQIFPEKMTFDGQKFGTGKMSLVYKINQESSGKKSQVVTSQGFEPKFLGSSFYGDLFKPCLSTFYRYYADSSDPHAAARSSFYRCYAEPYFERRLCNISWETLETF